MINEVMTARAPTVARLLPEPLEATAGPERRPPPVPVPRRRPVKVVHVATVPATLGFLHVPVKPVEAVIALSIVFVAAEIVRGRRGQAGLSARAPWLVAFTFGLLHGLGFASALSEVGLPQNAVPLALLFFNVGVEVGQLLFIGVVMTAIAGAVRAIEKSNQSNVLPRSVATRCEMIAAYAIGGVAASWWIERTLGAIA